MNRKAYVEKKSYQPSTISLHIMLKNGLYVSGNKVNTNEFKYQYYLKFLIWSILGQKCIFALYTLKSIRKIYLPCILVFKLMVQIFICLVVSSQSVSQNVVHRSVALESLGELIKDSFPYMRISGEGAR